MKTKNESLSAGVQDLCRKLKLQLEELATDLGADKAATDQEDEVRRNKLMEQLKAQLAELST